MFMKPKTTKIYCWAPHLRVALHGHRKKWTKDESWSQ